MSKIEINQTHDFKFRKRFTLDLKNDEGIIQSKGVMHFFDTSFGEGFIKTLGFSAVETPVNLRRGGNVRKIFDHAFDWAINEGAVVSVLHPFSFSYYEKFGYGKVADHLIVRLPIRLLDFVPRENNFVKYEGDENTLKELCELHNRFCRGRQLMMLRSDSKYFDNKELYIYYEDGRATGYISFLTEKRLEINHYEDGLMTVKDIVYTTPRALKAVLGFIRMFEGELEEVEFSNIATCPEIEMMLKHHTHTRYRLLPDLMVRVLNTEKLLLAHKYPKEKGSFVLKVRDTLPTVAGSFLVEYGQGGCTVGRVFEDTPADISVGAPMLARLLYGYDAITPEQAAFIDEIELGERAEDFFRAFKKRPSGMFEHF